jgi:hypothetical protein
LIPKNVGKIKNENENYVTGMTHYAEEETWYKRNETSQDNLIGKMQVTYLLEHLIHFCFMIILISHFLDVIVCCRLNTVCYF